MLFNNLQISQAWIGNKQVKEIYLNQNRLDFPLPVTALPAGGAPYPVLYQGKVWIWDGLSWIDRSIDLNILAYDTDEIFKFDTGEIQRRVR
jgi:hypothetical protein